MGLGCVLQATQTKPEKKTTRCRRLFLRGGGLLDRSKLMFMSNLPLPRLLQERGFLLDLSMACCFLAFRVWKRFKLECKPAGSEGLNLDLTAATLKTYSTKSKEVFKPKTSNPNEEARGAIPKSLILHTQPHKAAQQECRYWSS